MRATSLKSGPVVMHSRQQQTSEQSVIGGMKRRTFMQSLCVLGAGLALPSAARASEGEELATLLDISKCIACGACVQACRELNAQKFPEPVKPFPTMYPARVKAEDWSGRRDVDTRLTPYNWLYIQSCEVEYQGQRQVLNIPRRCLHCQNPPCANLCPWGAAAKMENGIVRIAPDICLGGAKCRDVCPWEIPQRQTGVGLYLHLLPAFAGNGVMYKCDRCHERVARGEKPACVEVCPEGVQEIGPRSLMLAKARQLAQEKQGFLYGDKENGGTNTFYVSPVPFDILAQAVPTGPGQPHLRDVADVMADETRLAAAVFLAPVAGVASIALRGAAALKGPLSGEHEGLAAAARPESDAATAPETVRKGKRRLLFPFIMTVLAITGMAQMPIFKRYYVADVPGLGWTADFYLTHKLHYAAAAILLFLLCHAAVRYVLTGRRHFRLTASGTVRVLLYAAISGTGLLRVIKNLHGFDLSPLTALATDWGHLIAVLLLGLVCLVGAAWGHSAYLRRR